jgi:hypothetical protein
LVNPRSIRAILLAAVVLATGARAQEPVDSASDAAPAGIIPAPPMLAALIIVAPPAIVAPAINEERIFGVIPNYQTVNDPNATVVALTARQKWTLFFKQSMDPFSLAGAAVGSVFSQMGNETPRYGRGSAALGKRFGAAVADCSTQSFFSAAVLATVLHQDPRYFRKGPGSGIPVRVLYSVSRLVVTRGDSGAQQFNTSGLLGMAMGIAASNLYYPSASISGPVMAGRLYTSVTGGMVGNLMSEFWPDLQKKFFHRRRSHEPQS